MIARVTRLLKELRLRHWRDTRARLIHALEHKTGRLRRHYPSAPSVWTEVPSDAIENASLSVFCTNRDILCDLNCPTHPPGTPFRFFGTSAPTQVDALDWHASIVCEGSWPQNHWTAIPFKSLSQLGDIKYSWEFARTQFLLAEAIHYAREGDASLAEYVRDVLVDFWNKNPREVGLHYISNMEIGIRSIVWLWLFACCGESKAFDDAFRRQLSTQLFLNGRHLHRKIKFTAATGRNNHLIGDAASLLIVSLVFTECDEARRWSQRAEQLLRECLDEQFLSSGMHFERSFGYLCFVLEFLWAVSLADGVSEDLRQPIEAKLYAATNVIESFGTPEGGLPAINDDDNGYVFFPLRDRIQQRTWLLNLASARFDGESTPAVQSTGGAQPEFTVFSHPSGSMVFVDHHGDPFPDSGHNHASLLGVLFWLDGEPILVDSGTYGYNNTGPLRNMFRGTSCHNTVTLDGKGQAEPSRGFGWLSRAEPSACESQIADRSLSFVGEHACFENATHRRHVFWYQEHRVLAIRDAILCGDARSVNQYWHFAPDLDVRELGGRRFSVTRDSSCLHVHALRIGDAKNDELNLFNNREALAECAFSPSYGAIETKPVLVRSWNTDGNAGWTVFCPDENVDLTMRGDDEAIDGGTWRLQFSLVQGTAEIVSIE